MVFILVWNINSLLAFTPLSLASAFSRSVSLGLSLSRSISLALSISRLLSRSFVYHPPSIRQSGKSEGYLGLFENFNLPLHIYKYLYSGLISYLGLCWLGAYTILSSPPITSSNTCHLNGFSYLLIRSCGCLFLLVGVSACVCVSVSVCVYASVCRLIVSSGFRWIKSHKNAQSWVFYQLKAYLEITALMAFSIKPSAGEQWYHNCKWAH